ncbi:MAG: hypothetical protein IJE43_23475 [Alphaproteobacteria bacterium]|nr:hypothetical protein [Alphaproteobacteria bacterium]
MKKYVILLISVLCIIFVGLYAKYNNFFIDKSIAIYCIVVDDNSIIEAKKICKDISKNNRNAVFSDINNVGNYNLYVASGYKNLPKNINKDAINILYIPFFDDKDTPELLRDFDVIVVKSASSFGHLKAINVRTAYIPNSIDINEKTEFIPNEEIVYIGNNEDFSLSLYLINNLNKKIDIYGEVKNKNLGKNNIISKNINYSKLKKYNLVLIDQTDEEIIHELVNNRILEIISQGKIPFVRYNPGIKKMFGDAIPMYYNPEHFNFELYRLLKSPNELMQRLEAITKISDIWSSDMRAKKFIELFDIMQKKRI